MPHSTIIRRTRSVVSAVTILFLATLVSAQTETVLYSFQPTNDITNPYSSLIADSAGNLYGTATSAGSGCAQDNCGGVFRLSPPSEPGGQWTETVIHNFSSSPNDGAIPHGVLARDRRGNLYGTTLGGGTYDYGTVFQLSPPTSPTAPWTETILYNFNLGISTGASPSGGVVIDANGNLYGTTEGGGAGYCYGYPGACGTAFELSPPPIKGAPWKHTIIHGFGSGYDGAYPQSQLFMGPGGVLYGTTLGGGIFDCGGGEPQGCGGVFQLTPPASAGAKWTEAFYNLPNQSVGEFFFGGVVQGRNGALYAPIYAGGPGQNCTDVDGFSIGCGGILELAPPAPGSSKWHVNTIYTFTGLGDGALLLGSLTSDDAGNLYGTTGSGGGLGNCAGSVFVYSSGCGTVFKLSPPSSAGAAWTETVLHSFSATPDGEQPWGTLLLNNGTLYGTTAFGGYDNGFSGLGTVFSVVP
jgi:uncharacterized repeat protein (TIGR03803 family)